MSGRGALGMAIAGLLLLGLPGGAGAQLRAPLGGGVVGGVLGRVDTSLDRTLRGAAQDGTGVVSDVGDRHGRGLIGWTASCASIAAASPSTRPGRLRAPARCC